LVELVAVDDEVLEHLVHAAVTRAAADEVTPAVTAGCEWTAARITWLTDFHRERRPGLDGPAGEATWAICVNRDVVGSVRLKRTGEQGVLETGIWLAQDARGCGIGRAAMTALLGHAVASGAVAVRAQTMVSNANALALLRKLGFDLQPAKDSGLVHAALLVIPTVEPGVMTLGGGRSEGPGTPAARH
jgi:RimJ/RimL family protein N-acetyltransferase